MALIPHLQAPRFQLSSPLSPYPPNSWWAHLHASEVGSTWEELLEGPSQEEVAKAVALLQVEREKQRAGGAADAAGRYQAGRQRLPDAEGAPGGGSHASNNIQPPAGDGQACGCAAVAAASASGSSSRVRGVAGEAAAREGPSSISGSSSDGSGMGGSTGGERGGGQGPLDIVPHDAWLTRLRSLLVSHPHALVGEVGVDRAAVIPGSRARVRFDHQMALLRQQLAVAAELGRPVSIHCVRGYGHLLQLFAGLPRDGGGCPPAVMLHSYGGSPEDVARFCRLPDIGRRFFFSFSSAINGRAPDKMAARIRAVPDDRLLLESDQVRGAAALALCPGGLGAVWGRGAVCPPAHHRSGRLAGKVLCVCKRRRPGIASHPPWAPHACGCPGDAPAGGPGHGRHLPHRGRRQGVDAGASGAAHARQLQ